MPSSRYTALISLITDETSDSVPFSPPRGQSGEIMGSLKELWAQARLLPLFRADGRRGWASQPPQHLCRATAPSQRAPLRLSPAGRQCAEELGRAQRAQLRLQRKRLAVEVEDHPRSYAHFEGDIAHAYGKGHVDPFDTGVWTSQGDAQAQRQKGHLRFELFGSRLKGGWQLERSGRKQRQPAWFLSKARNSFAGTVEADDLLDATMKRSTRNEANARVAKAAATRSIATKKPLPGQRKLTRARLARAAAALDAARSAHIGTEFFTSELARLGKQPPTGDDWLHELKWDGYRLLAPIADGQVQLWSRNALSWNEPLPDIVHALQALGL